MTKLRKAICGDDNKNLDDLKYMTGKILFTDPTQTFVVVFACGSLRPPVYLFVFTNLYEIQPLLGLLVLGGTKYIIFAEFVHTGDIESMNNLQLKYANKTFSYRFDVTS